MLTKTLAFLAAALLVSCGGPTETHDAGLLVIVPEDAGVRLSGEDAGGPPSGEDAAAGAPFQPDAGSDSGPGVSPPTDPNVVAIVGPAALLEIDGTTVYWGEEHYDYSWTMFPRVVVKSMPKSGGPQTTLAEFPALVAWSLGVDASNVYIGSSLRDDECWMPPCSAPMTLRAIPKAGGPLSFIAHCGLRQFASDDESVFCGGWIGATEDSPSGILRVRLGGSPVLLNDTLTSVVTISDGDVFFRELGFVMRMPKTGGEPTSLFAQPLNGGKTIKVESRFVYFDTQQGIYRVPRLGGKPAMLRAGTITSLDARGGYVFWTEQHCLGVMRSDGSGERCLETQGNPQSVHVDDTALFFIRERDATTREIVRLTR
ncbi:MAG: hypothetical protein HY901_16035 [Deltaproteobacteria bacterium]|nr:hypothetical protein [Deltaproteobacteria bacterium]